MTWHATLDTACSEHVGNLYCHSNFIQDHFKIIAYYPSFLMHADGLAIRVLMETDDGIITRTLTDRVLLHV